MTSTAYEAAAPIRRRRSLPTAGTLYFDVNGPLGGGRTAVTPGQIISAADILAGRLIYLAPAGARNAPVPRARFCPASRRPRTASLWAVRAGAKGRRQDRKPTFRRPWREMVRI